MGLIVNSVGDAACISLFSSEFFLGFNHWNYYDRGWCSKQNKVDLISNSSFPIDLVIDYGKYNQNTHSQVSKTKNFLLTHFHRDHYYGFEYGHKVNGCKYENIKNFYYQKLPRINDDESSNQPIEQEQQLAFLICFVNVLESFRYLRDNGQCSLFNLLDVIDNPNTEKIAVGKGDKIEIDNTHNHMVIWPPECIDKNDDIVKGIKWIFDKKSINEFILNEFYFFKEYVKKIPDGKTNKHSKIDIVATNKQYIDALKKEINSNEISHIDSVIKFCRSNRNILYESKENIVKRISSIANDLSVCTYNSELLQLGDLDKNINKCISSYLDAINLLALETKYFVTAHHGTHWGKKCDKVSADYVISSNGQRRYCDLKCKYINSLKDSLKNNVGKIKKRFYSTYLKDNFLGY